MDFVTSIKQRVVDDRSRIELHDAVSDEVRRVIGIVSGDQFSPNSPWSDEEFGGRVARYDEVLADLCRAEALMAYWGHASSVATLTLPIERLSDGLKDANGVTGWLALRWYAVLLLMYAAGLPAVAANRYDMLAGVFLVPLMTTSRGHELAVVATVEGLNDAASAFKSLSGMERKHVPRSEHMFAWLQQILEPLLFLGSGYERAFDRVEILYALEYAHRTDKGWPPIGRFGWKSSYRESSPLHRLIVEAEATRDAWAPLEAGFCGGSFERFAVISKHLTESVARRQMY